ncbi:MAG TPA: hypothetical protein VNJ12_02845 [Candidatus Dormibacteraeota bacterium]|nr:hypothetical protein [Candidatus Dormibacteraeota bacterium]
MTIVAGMRFNGGVILCADTQETIDQYSKTWTPKLVVKPQPWYAKDSPDDLMVAMAGAGEGPWVDKLTERAWEDVKEARSFENACAGMEESIKESYRHYGAIFQPGAMPSAELLYGVKMQAKSGLFRASGPLVKELDYAAIGAGRHLADFLTDRLHQRYFPGPQAVILAAYVLFQCIEHVDGCGGDKHIAALNEAGDSGMLDPVRIDFLVTQLRDVQDAAADLLLSAPDFSMRPEDFDEGMKSLIERIKEMRRTGEHMKKLLDEMRTRRPEPVPRP